MSVKAALAPDSSTTLTITVSGRFDYSVRKAFLEAYTTPDNDQIKHYVIDLSQAEYMDSSALGMLLIIKEFADKNAASVSLSKPQPMVRKVLEIANFNRFFTLTDAD